MSADDVLDRDRRERELWRRYPSEMARLAPGDLPEGATHEQRAVMRQWRERYARVLAGELSPRGAVREVAS